MSALAEVTTSSPALAERPRNASCLSVVSSVVQYVERNLLLLVTSASDLPLRTNKFCSVLFSSLWSSMLVVINKDPLMRGGLYDKLHGRPSQLLLPRPAVIDPMVRYWRRIAISAYSTSPLGGGGVTRQNIAMTFGMEKLE